MESFLNSFEQSNELVRFALQDIEGSGLDISTLE